MILRRLLVALAPIVVAAGILSGPPGEPPRAAADERGAEARPGELLVELRQAGLARAVASRVGASLGEAVPGGGGVRRLHVPPGQEQARAARLRQDPAVAAVAPNYVRRAQVTPSDPYYPMQWALARIRMPAAWDVTTGAESIKVAVLDSGADLDHPDLRPKLLPGTSTLAVDPAPSGQPGCGPSTEPRDDYPMGHGTHVAGIAGAATGNAAGVAGVAWRAMLLPVKVLDCKGEGTDASVIAGIDWAISAGARVINLSVGGPGQSDVLDAAVARAHRAGVLVVAAVGNRASDVPEYPAASPHALAVGATDPNDRLAPFSNRGDHIGVVAPGVSVLSTYPRWLTSWQVEPGYQYKSGTSMASPQVAGLAALILSRHPTYDPARVGAIIRASADRVYLCPSGVPECPYDAQGRNQWYGHGRINAAAAVRMAQVLTLVLVPRGAPP